MKRAVFIISILLLKFSLSEGQNTGPLFIADTLSDQQLVQDVLLNTGVLISNISYTGAAIATGEFTCDSCGLGIAHGILLTNGNIHISPGPNGGTGSGLSNGLSGDADLDSIVAPFLSKDASVLEFDFKATSDSVEFRYVFGSEEYNDYVNTNFNDVFAFFISGPGISGVQNIALIPGSNLPVSINNVNNGSASANTNAAGPCTNCTYYNDNANITSPVANIEYDGFTTVLTATAQVMACQTYHIKLAVSDVQDHIFDSGVFLEGNSLAAVGQQQIRIAGTNSMPDSVIILIGDSVQLEAEENLSYSWSNGESTQVISAKTSGNYSMTVSNGTCFAFSNTISVIIDSLTTGIAPLPFPTKIALYPNPTANKTVVELGDLYSNVSFDLYNIMGKKVQSKIVGITDLFHLDIQNLSQGIYFLELKNPWHNQRFKILKQ